MIRRLWVGCAVAVCVMAVGTVFAPCAGAETIEVPFTSDRWETTAGRTVEHLGRTAFEGSATLNEVAFTDGTIEVDIAVTGARSYPGIVFRTQGDGGGENVYVRPHRAGLYDDAVQYTPMFRGVSCWQLYNGDGFTAGTELPVNEWITLRVEVEESRARVFVGDSGKPALLIENLKRDPAAGAIGVKSPMGGTAFFSNFRFSQEAPPAYGVPAYVDIPPGLLTEWQVSEPLPPEYAASERLPDPEVVDGLTWSGVEAEPSGLVNLTRFVPRTGPTPDAVLARTTVTTETSEVRQLRLGYSDQVTVFLNGLPLFTGSSAYRERDPSFLGIVGMFDTVYLPLEQGSNELTLLVSEVFGGWAFQAGWGGVTHVAPGVEKLWETTAEFKVPESVAWDSKREVYYVSNYDGYNPSRGEGRQSISRIAADGSTVDPDWVTGLRNPVGLKVRGDRLWVAERTGLAVIDIESESILERHEVGAGFPNDITLDREGRVYLSDSRRGVVYRFTDGAFEEWLTGRQVQSPNGLHVMGDELLIGVNGDHCIKAADLETGELRTVSNLGPGIIDGIGDDGNGNIIVSHWQGRIFRITPDGNVTKMLDTSVPVTQSADIAVVPETGMLLVPTFLGNRVVAYRLGSQPEG
jgi:sugar lactone lactonase YvrE